MKELTFEFNTTSIEDYDRFIGMKRLPRYTISGNTLKTDEVSYNLIFGGRDIYNLSINNNRLFDYQQWVVNRALSLRRFAAFLDCGLGKTAITLHWAQEIATKLGKVIIACPLQVLPEFVKDAEKFGISCPITNLRDTGGKWDEGIGLINYEGRADIDMTGVFGMALDESSILKNGDGATTQWLYAISANVEYRLTTSATPAPNEQAEYAGHAVFLGITDTEKEFYSRFFRKDGNDYILKGHAVDKFYEYLSSWGCYIQDPAKLGFECGGRLDHEPEYIPIELPGGIEAETLIALSAGLVDMRKIEAFRCESGTPRFEYVVEQAQKQKCILWCTRDIEEANFHAAIPGSALITGKTPIEKRVEIINDWRAGVYNCLISKPKILGWGVNLQEADAHIVSGYNHSFEAFYQMVRRSHRFPRQTRLKVFLPVTGCEWPVLDVLWEKLQSFESDIFALQKKFNSGKIVPLQ